MPPFPPAPPIACIGTDSAVGETQRARRIEIPPPSAVPPFVPSAPLPPTVPPPEPSAPVRPRLPSATLFTISHTEESVTLPPEFRIPALLGRQSVLNGQVRDGDGAAQDLEDAIEIIAVDDRVGGARSFDRDLSFQVEVAGRTGFLVGPRNRQRERARGHDDRTRPFWHRRP